MHRTAGDGRTEDVPPLEDAAWTPPIRRAVSISLFRNKLAAAAALLAPAAHAGVPAAQYSAGVVSEHGIAVAGLGAAQWYLRAAEQNFAPAQARLGTLYLEGQDVPQNFIEAYTWLSLAAANGIDGAREQRDRAGSHLTEQALAQAQRWTAALWQEHIGPDTTRRLRTPREPEPKEPEPLLPPLPQAPSRPH
jgi:TPR repeat protein